jgi:imidazolonepropionase-like amidohydrolase
MRLPISPPPHARGEDVQNVVQRATLDARLGALEQGRHSLLRAWKAGVPLVAGTDAGNPLVFHGPSLHHELQLWVQAGIPPEVALEAATRNAANLLRAGNRLGTIRKGLEANLLLVDGNPLQDISATERISLVVFEGERLRRSELFEKK